MKRRTIILIVVGCSSVTLVVGVALWLWSLPPQFQPEIVYKLKFGALYPTSRPAGDYTLIDCGPRAGIDRYVVDLGDLVDASEIDKTFLVSDLPAEEFIVGLQVSGGTGAGSLLFEKPDIGTVRLEVTTESGGPVLIEHGPLSDWIWSGPLHMDDYAFVYRIRGNRPQSSSGDGAEGEGTIFAASPDDSYHIHIRATWQPETPERYKIRLLMKGGGWQS